MLKRMDHNAYPKSLRGKTLAELYFILKDAGEAQRANPDNPNVGYYADEVSYAGMELRRRGVR
jgi:hypothetical protein